MFATVLMQEAARINRLIDQLGSQVYSEREAASRALKRLGEPALELLQKASQESPDAEIRRRAERLVAIIEPPVIEARARAIRESQLTSEEKGRRLQPLVKEGMTHDEVFRILGSAIAEFHGVEYYQEYGFAVSYGQHRGVESVFPLPWRPRTFPGP
jgi:hypothetical protein